MSQEIKEFKAEDYTIGYNSQTSTVTLTGSLRLSGLEETNPVIQILYQVLAEEPETIILNLQDLEFLNSSGINMLSKFVIKVRQKSQVNLVIKASSQIPWQGKSLKNLQRLMPSLKLELD